MRFAKQLPVGQTDIRLELEAIRRKKAKAENKPKKPLFLGVRAIGVLALLMLGAIVSLEAGRDFNPAKIADVKNSPHELARPGMAMQFIETPEQLSTILGSDGAIQAHNRQAARDDIRRDYYFIAAYSLLYIALSLLLSKRRGRWTNYLAWVALAAGLGAAIFDVRENMGILDLVNSTAVTQRMVNTIHLAATVKWALTFFTAAILAVVFYGYDNWLRLIGFLLTLTAALGFASLYYIPLLKFALLPMLGGLVLLLILSLAQPRRLIEQLH